MKIKQRGFMFSIENLTREDLFYLFFALQDTEDLVSIEEEDDFDPQNCFYSILKNKLIAEIKRLKIFGDV